MYFFLKKLLFFKIFGAFGAKNLESYVPDNPIFGVRAPLGQSPPFFISDYNPMTKGIWDMIINERNVFERKILITTALKICMRNIIISQTEV